MKTLVKFLAVALVAVALTTQAQQVTYKPVTLDTSGITTLAGQSASNSTQVILCPWQATVALQLEFTASAATTDNITFVFYPTVDGSTYATAGVAIPLAMTGATKRTVVTNLPAQYGIQQWKLGYVTNAAATAGVTQLAVKYGQIKGL